MKGLIHTYRCKASKSRGHKRGAVVNVPAGSHQDKTFARDPAWVFEGGTPLDGSPAHRSACMLKLEQARVQMVRGEYMTASKTLEEASKLARGEAVADESNDEQSDGKEPETTVKTDGGTQPDVTPLTKTEIARANKGDLLKALRDVGAYKPGMEAETKAALTDALIDAYGELDTDEDE